MHFNFPDDKDDMSSIGESDKELDLDDIEVNSNIIVNNNN